MSICVVEMSTPHTIDDDEGSATGSLCAICAFPGAYLRSRRLSSTHIPAPASLLIGRMLQCPWCEKWEPLESYTMLQLPPNHTRQCLPVYKHGGESGGKKLFSIDPERA